MSEGSWDGPWQGSTGALWVLSARGSTRSCVEIQGRAWRLSLAPAAILLWKLNTESAQTSWLVLVPQRCLLVRDLGAIVALEPQLFATWPEGTGNGC